MFLKLKSICEHQWLETTPSNENDLVFFDNLFRTCFFFFFGGGGGGQKVYPVGMGF